MTHSEAALIADTLKNYADVIKDIILGEGGRKKNKWTIEERDLTTVNEDSGTTHEKKTKIVAELVPLYTLAKSLGTIGENELLVLTTPRNLEQHIQSTNE